MGIPIDYSNLYAISIPFCNFETIMHYKCANAVLNTILDTKNKFILKNLYMCRTVSSLKFFAILLISMSFVMVANAKLKLPAILSSNMVLQQKQVNRIWGWADPRQAVQLNFAGIDYLTSANTRGEWQILLQPLQAGNAGALKITAGLENLVLENILIGEIWVCSGQSNMEWRMNMMGDTYKQEMLTANNDQIRYLTVRKTVNNMVADDLLLDQTWTAINPATIGGCSAVGYWYAKQLQAKLKVPVGLIVSAWGGTSAQPWVSVDGLYEFPHYVADFRDRVLPVDLNEIEQLRAKSFAQYQADLLVNAGKNLQLVSPQWDDHEWKDMKLPGQWEGQGYSTMDGVAYYRLRFNVSSQDAGKAAKLNMPAIDDMDSTYINGIFIGAVNQWDAERKYEIPAGVLKAGENLLAIRVEDGGGGGGLASVPSIFYIQIEQKKIMLEGKAKFWVMAQRSDPIGGNISMPQQASLLFNAMIAPLLNYSIQGVIWYQGESNADQAVEYRKLFPALIKNWRNQWHRQDMPFYFVQLSSFGAITKEPAMSNWAMLREAQTLTLQLPNTGMAVTTDIGNPENIHPLQKKEVGDRLSLIALRDVYKTSVAAIGGPILKSYAVQGNQIVLQLDPRGGKLKIKGPKLMHFAIAGADQHFVWADAVIKNNSIIVSSKQVSKPVAVRYAWADSPITANLYNSADLPAVPFRTDDWEK